MELQGGLGQRNIKAAIADYPGLGVILERYGIGCTKCSIGTCLLQDVVAVHFLGAETEAQIETELNAYLASGQQPAQP
jgi:hypothetical protein